MCKFPLKASVQISVQSFFTQIVQSAFVKGFPKSFKMARSRNKYRFNLV